VTETKKAHPYLGVFLAMLCGAAWGTTSVSSRYLAFERGVYPPTSVFWRFASSLPFLLVAYVLWGKGPRLQLKDLPKIIWLGALGIFLMANFNFYSSRYTTNINSTMIITASAVLIALIAHFFGDKVTRGQWAGVILGLAGVALIGFAKSPKEPNLSLLDHSFGIFLATLASLSGALYTYLGQSTVAKYGGIRVTVWCITAGVLMQFVFVAAAALVKGQPLAGPFLPHPTGGSAAGVWAVFIYLGIVPTAFAFTVWFVAMKHIDVTTLGMGQYVSPVISTALGWGLLGETILVWHILGAALIFAGLHFAARRRPGASDAAGRAGALDG
jgi:drug/metabolite transporter (DMT)-like permease